MSIAKIHGVVVLAVLFSLPSSLNAKTKISFWHTMNDEESKTLNSILTEYRKAHPDVELDAQFVPFSEAQNKYKLSAMAGDAPDVFRAEIAWVVEYAALGVLAPLDELMPKEDRADYLDTSMRYFTYKDQTWGVPQVTDTLALLYNKKMFADKKVQVPQTMTEFLEAAEKLGEPKKDVFGFALIPQGYFFQPFLWAFGGDLLQPDSRKIAIDQKPAVEALEFYRNLATNKELTGGKVDFVNGYTNAVTGFKDGKYAMMINGPWVTSEVLTGRAFENPANLGVAVIPPGPKGHQGSPVGGHGYILYRGSKQSKAAFDFIQFINQKTYQIRFAKENHLLPTRKSAYEEQTLKNSAIFQGFWQQLQVAKNRPVIPEGGLIYKDLDINLQATLRGKVSSELALKQTAEAWRQILKTEM